MIGEYVQQLKEIIEELFDNGVDRPAFAIGIFQELARDRRMKEIARERRNSEELATDEQMAYLRSLGVDCDEGMTNAEASKLIHRDIGNDSL